MKRLLAFAGVILLSSSAAAFPSLPAPATVTARLQDAIRALEIESEEDRCKAIQEIQSLGPWGRPAVPALCKLLPESSPRVASAIAYVFARHGTAAKEARPLLLEIIRRPGLDTMLLSGCAQAIAAIGDAGNPDMVRAILSVDNGGRKVAVPVEELLWLYPAEMIPVVADHLRDPDARRRARAAIYLYRVIRRYEENKPALIESLASDARKGIVDRLREGLEDPEARVRDWVVPAIVDLDPKTLREAMPVFVTLIRRHEGYGAAEDSIARRGPEAARMVLDYIDDPNPDVRTALAGTLAKCRGKIQPVLAAGLRHPNPVVRTNVLVAFTFNISHAKSMRSAIVGRLADDDPQVRLTAATTLVTINPTNATPAVPVLAEASFSRSRSDRLRAIGFLQSMGGDARPAIDALFRRVHSGDIDTRFAAARALAAIDRSTWRTFVPALIETIAFGDVRQRHASADLLGQTGTHAKLGLPALRAMLTDEHFSNRVASAEAMIRIAPDDIDDSIKFFVDALSSEPGINRNIRAQRRLAIAAITRIGALAKPTVPALLEVMRTESNEHLAMLAASAAIKADMDQCEEAYERFRFHLQPGNPDPDDMWLDAIPQLGKAAKPLIPDLVAAVSGKSNYQRNSAIETLTQLGPDAKDALPALKEIAKNGKGPSSINDAIKAIEGKK